MATQIRKCTCQSEFQDLTYGKGNRLMNEAGKDGKLSELHCTVCGKTYSLK